MIVFCITINKEQIEMTNQILYIGMVLDSDLAFCVYVDCRYMLENWKK